MINQKRLMNLIKAVRESPIPEAFTMGCYIRGNRHDTQPDGGAIPANWCGTPACILGHYAAREDLQKLLRVEKYGDNAYRIVYVRNGEPAEFQDTPIHKHFGISDLQAYRLFSSVGCNEAQTPAQAITYIEELMHQYNTEP